MNYTVYRMQFHTGVHLGMRRLEDGEHSLYADTLFSALCQEAVQAGSDVLQQFVSCSASGAVQFTDAFPYHEETCYIPKPMLTDCHQQDRDSVRKKALKKLEYIPADSLNAFLSGKLDVMKESRTLKKMGAGEIRMHVFLDEEQSRPYPVGTYRFHDGWGLYFILGWKAESDRNAVENLLKGLQYAGIGGKRKSGLGRFTLIRCEKDEVGSGVPEALCQMLQAGETESEDLEYISLTTALPSEAELDEALENARYSIVRRSGFVSSETYSDVPLKKAESYMLKSGSVFQRRFEGEILDVSETYSETNAHPVYRYAKPMFLGVKKNGK